MSADDLEDLNLRQALDRLDDEWNETRRRHGWLDDAKVESDARFLKGLGVVLMVASLALAVILPIVGGKSSELRTPLMLVSFLVGMPLLAAGIVCFKLGGKNAREYRGEKAEYERRRQTLASQAGKD